MNDESFRDLQRQTAELAAQTSRLAEVVDEVVRNQRLLTDQVNSTNPASPGVSMRVDRVERRHQFLFGTNIAFIAGVYVVAWKIAQVVDKLGLLKEF